MTNTTGREAVLTGLRQYEEELLSELRQVRESIVKFGGTPRDTGKPKPLDTHKDLTACDLGPQQLVENYLRDHPKKFFRPQAIAKAIVEGGYHPTNPKLWPTQVRNCLKRAIEKDISTARETAAGKKVYGLKEEAETVSGEINKGNSSS